MLGAIVMMKCDGCDCVCDAEVITGSVFYPGSLEITWHGFYEQDDVNKNHFESAMLCPCCAHSFLALVGKRKNNNIVGDKDEGS